MSPLGEALETDEHSNVYLGEGIAMVYFELEEVVSKFGKNRSRPLLEQAVERSLPWVNQLARKHHAAWRDYIESKAPYFHPGRVFVSSEVLTRLGRREILFYLNCFLRGACSDGAYAGEHYQFACCHDLTV